MRVAVNGVRVYFDVAGEQVVPEGSTMREKPTLLVLHGGPGFDHSMLKPWFGGFADVAQVVYLDHRANGRSERGPVERQNLAQWGDDVRGFCDALDIAAPVVLGVSFGGMVAQSYATQHPDHPRALVLCNTAARVHAARVLDAFEKLGGAEARAAAQAFLLDSRPENLEAYARLCLPLYNRTPQDPAVMARAMPQANFELTTRFFREQWQSFDFLPALGKLRCPTLVIGSEHDPITPFADSEDIAAALPKEVVRLERFEGCGHPAYQDAPERFDRLLREFLGALPAT